METALRRCNQIADRVDAEGAVVWVAGCPACGSLDLDSFWPRPDLVHPRSWRCRTCLSSTWEPIPLRLPT